MSHFRDFLKFHLVGRQPAPQIVNPFFDAWRNGQFLNQQQISFSDLMNRNSRPPNLPSSAVHMSEVESRMKQQQSMNGMAPPPNVTKFFQNMANFVPQNHNVFPQQNMAGPPIHDVYNKALTQQELQNHTAEIMRNAIMRKNYQK